MLKVKLKNGNPYVYFKRKATPIQKYNGKLLSEINKCFQEETRKHGKMYMGGSAGYSFHNKALPLGPKILREFKRKYSEKYKEGLDAFIKNDKKKVQEVIRFLRNKLKIKLVESRKKFEVYLD